MPANARIVHALYPEVLYTEIGFQKNLGVLIENDRIALVTSHEALALETVRRRDAGAYVTERRLPAKALLPGFVNTHSHAFQRGIRGRTEYPGQKGREDFWSWREVMYQTAAALSPKDIEALALGVYIEMIKAGITQVGEFHYLHHNLDGTPYEDPNELSMRVLRAAQGAGLRPVLLRSFYRRAGLNRPLPEGAQVRFCDPSLDFYIASLEKLMQEGHRVAVTPHSIRAVPKVELQELVAWAHNHQLPFHIHVSEQIREVEECIAEYGLPPVSFLHDLEAISSTSTLVHAIHLSDEEIEVIGRNHATVATCPTTERNLGDGVVQADRLLRAGASLTLGSDSQCQIAPFENARQLEYHRRLQAQVRSVLFTDMIKAGSTFLSMLTTNGWRSLGGQGGLIAPDQPADLISIDLDHLNIAGWTLESLAIDLIFSAPSSIVRDVWVGGKEVLCDGNHPNQDAAKIGLRKVLAKLRSGKFPARCGR